MTEVMVNTPDDVFGEREGRIERIPSVVTGPPGLSRSSRNRGSPTRRWPRFESRRSDLAERGAKRVEIAVRRLART
jgi:hypothetical protein